MIYEMKAFVASDMDEEEFAATVDHMLTCRFGMDLIDIETDIIDG